MATAFGDLNILSGRLGRAERRAHVERRSTTPGHAPGARQAALVRADRHRGHHDGLQNDLKSDLLPEAIVMNAYQINTKMANQCTRRVQQQPPHMEPPSTTRNGPAPPHWPVGDVRDAQLVLVDLRA